MKFGTFQLQSIPPWTNAHDVVQHHWEQMLAAERLGFHEIWLAEHNGRPYGMIGNTVTVAAALAGATQRIRIATAVTRLPLHHPTHLAEDLKSAHFNFADGELLPPPLSPGNISTYVMVSGSEQSVQWAAKRGRPIAIGSGPGWDDIKSRLEMYAETAAAAGFSDSVIEHNLKNTWQLRQVHVARTTEKAIAEYKRGLMWYMEAVANRAMFGFAREQQPYEYYVEHKAVVLGSPEKVTEELAEYCALTGINNIICWFNLGGQPHAQVLSALEMFSGDVMPGLQSVGYNWSMTGRTKAAPTSAAR